MSDQAAAARKAFGTRLRDMRRDAGYNGRSLAEALGWHPSKVSRIELGQQNPSEDDIRRWAIECGAARQIPELIAVSREIEQMWVEHRRELRAGQKRVQSVTTPLYEQTKILRAYESVVIPGMLQTRGYVYAVMEANARLFDLPTDDLHEATEARLERQRLLTEGPSKYAFVIEAGALGTMMGDPAAMHEQYDFLLQASRFSKVSLGIIPPARPRVLFAGENFYVFDDEQVRNDLWSGAIRTKRPDEIAHYLKVWATLRSMAVFGAAARKLIEAARGQLPQSDAIS